VSRTPDVEGALHEIRSGMALGCIWPLEGVGSTTGSVGSERLARAVTPGLEHGRPTLDAALHVDLPVPSMTTRPRLGLALCGERAARPDLLNMPP
jgi:hypothetical protein